METTKKIVLYFVQHELWQQILFTDDVIFIKTHFCRRSYTEKNSECRKSSNTRFSFDIQIPHSTFHFKCYNSF